MKKKLMQSSHLIDTTQYCTYTVLLYVTLLHLIFHFQEDKEHNRYRQCRGIQVEQERAGQGRAEQSTGSVSSDPHCPLEQHANMTAHNMTRKYKTRHGMAYDMTCREIRCLDSAWQSMV